MTTSKVSELFEQTNKNTIVIHLLPHNLSSFKELAETVV